MIFEHQPNSLPALPLTLGDPRTISRDPAKHMAFVLELDDKDSVLNFKLNNFD